MIREERKKRRQAKRALYAALIVVLFLLLAAFIISKVFVIKEVKVEGNELYEEQLIVETILNDEYSWNSLYVLLKYTFTDAEKVPFIDAIEVELNNPQTITLKVYEKGLLGYLYISSMNENAYFDKDGFVIETSTRLIDNVPQIEGVACDEVILYEKLPVGDQLLREMLMVTQALKRESETEDAKEKGISLIPDRIEYGKPHSPILYYGDTQVWLGSTEELTQKVFRLFGIFPSIKGEYGMLHMENWSQERDNILFEFFLQEEGDADNS